MYIQGHKQYDHHLKTYGHPADNGFMEMDNRWKAENWNPGELLDLYKKAGARYFMSLANHHDNFDNYNSRFHDWNSTRVGPKRDIIGTWAKEARARGLKFGVSNHSAHSWHWFQVAYGYDPEGLRAGQRYDAFKLTKYDGKGKWWEGLDPQELYAGAVMPMPDGIISIKDADAFHEAHDRVWNETPPLANPAFIRQWYLRCKDLIDSYRPDMVYFDNFDLPLGQAGLDITAHYYNSSIAWHGALQAVVNCKALPENGRAAVVEDVERGFRADIVPHPWQTDTCLGDWHYNRARYTDKSYMSAAAVIYRLCDVVAKNGCLLLSVPVRGDGTIDSEERGHRRADRHLDQPLWRGDLCFPPLEEIGRRPHPDCFGPVRRRQDEAVRGRRYTLHHQGTGALQIRHCFRQTVASPVSAGDTGLSNDT